MHSVQFRKIVLLALFGVLVVSAAGAQATNQSQQPEQTPIPMTLPFNREATLKEGEGQQLVVDNCMKCHTLQPILTHDGFTPAVWESTVTKMRDAYGAEITDADASGIVTYLSTHYSGEPASTADMLVYGIGASPATKGADAATPDATIEGTPAQLPSD